MSLWIPVIAALGASFLTGALLWAVTWWQQWQAGRAAAKQQRIDAYRALLVHSHGLLRRTISLPETMRLRSGLGASLAILLHLRKPLDPFKLFDWIEVAFKPLNDAWLRVWTVGTQEMIDAADRLVDACGDLQGLATSPNLNRSRLLRTVVGDAWTEEQEDAFKAAHVRVAEETVVFARLIRREEGQAAVTFALERAKTEREQDA